MSTSLVTLGQTDIQRGGLGLNSKIFQLKPATIQLVQALSKAEGAIPGKLRVSDSGQHFDEMQVVMLFEPVEQRAYFVGEEFSKDAKVCFSLDNLKPHEKAKIPQAMACGYYDTRGNYVTQCPKAKWDKYRQTKLRADLPPCRTYWHCVLADRITQLPYYLNVKGTSIPAFEQAMGQVAKLIGLMQASGESPNIFDVSFKIKPFREANGKPWTLRFTDIAPLKKEDRPKFGAIFLDFANRRAQGAVAPDEESAPAETASAAPPVDLPTGVVIDAAVTEAPAAVNGEIVI